MQFGQVPSKAKWLIALVVATIVYVMICTSLERKLPSDLSPRFSECMQASCSPILRRVVEYCALDAPSGTDGVNSQLEEWELTAVLLNIRHGDRTSIHTIDDASHPSLRKDYIAPEALHFLPSPNLYHALEMPDNLLDKGQLTSRGFMQHIQLGRFLRNAYKPVISTLNASKQIYIRSTNYPRTLQSVTALTSQLLPQSIEYRINFFPDTRNEVMLIDFSTRSTSCFRAVQAEKNQQVVYKQTSAHIYREIEAVLGLDSSQFVTPVAVTELADTALPAVCHASTPLQRPFPCVKTDGRTRCMTPEFVAMLMNESDTAYCRRFTDADGGDLSTRLYAYPFMQEIKKYLLSSITASGPKITIFSGHDTVIAPVLASLGVYKHVCRWPRYASRVALEIWRKAASDPALSASYTVRVMFNGDDLTSYVPSCLGKVIRTQRADLCPLDRIVHQIDSLIDSYGSWEDACDSIP